MELHSHAAAKKLWNYLRVAFFMMRKGFASKRKLLMDMNLLMKRGNKLLTKSLAILMFHHHHLPGAPEIPAFGRREYEFSCSNSPNPAFYHGSRAQQRRRHHYFPCLHAVVEDDQAAAVVLPPRIAYSSSSSSPQCFSILQYSQDLAPGEQSTPPSTASSSLISLPSVWNYSSGDDETDDDDELSGREVDDEAEEFIKRFYEQLRAQSRIALLQYQELEYQQMLIRGV